jgi:hypothetical protein
MSLSEAWDRMFWSIMLVIFIGLLWMKFLQETARCESVGLVVSISGGIAFFGSGWYQAQRRKAREIQEEQAENEIIQVPEDLV